MHIVVGWVRIAAESVHESHPLGTGIIVVNRLIDIVAEIVTLLRKRILILNHVRPAGDVLVLSELRVNVSKLDGFGLGHRGRQEHGERNRHHF